jgi:hypothetical protein
VKALSRSSLAEVAHCPAIGGIGVTTLIRVSFWEGRFRRQQFGGPMVHRLLDRGEADHILQEATTLEQGFRYDFEDFTSQSDSIMIHRSHVHLNGTIGGSFSKGWEYVVPHQDPSTEQLNRHN